MMSSSNTTNQDHEVQQAQNFDEGIASRPGHSEALSKVLVQDGHQNDVQISVSSTSESPNIHKLTTEPAQSDDKKYVSYTGPLATTEFYDNAMVTVKEVEESEEDTTPPPVAIIKLTDKVNKIVAVAIEVVTAMEKLAQGAKEANSEDIPPPLNSDNHIASYTTHRRDDDFERHGIDGSEAAQEEANNALTTSHSKALGNPLVILTKSMNSPTETAAKVQPKLANNLEADTKTDEVRQENELVETFKAAGIPVVDHSKVGKNDYTTKKSKGKGKEIEADGLTSVPV